MKRISCFLLLSTLLASCATSARYSFGSVVTPTPVVTEINAPTATAVFTPTSQPTPTPTEAPKFTIDALNLDPALTAALKKHAGLEASITVETDGRYTAAVTVLSDGQPVAKTVDLDPKTMTQDLTTKNKYGDTPVMTTVDGQKLYWVQEEQAWFALEISTDISKPVMIPYGKAEISTRIVVAEFPESFSQKAVDWWKISPDLKVEFQYLVTNAKSGASTRFAYLRNDAMGFPGRTIDNSPIQFLNAWFAMDYPDGTRFEYSPTKWLDPSDPRNPKGDEWKIINTASGPEVMGDKNARDKYLKIYTDASTKPGSHLEVLPVVSAQDGFFDGTNNMITLLVPQPSLNKLMTSVNEAFNILLVPSDPNGQKFKEWIDGGFGMLSVEHPSVSWGFQGKNDSTYVKSFFPDNIQTIIFPSIIVLR